MDSEVSRARLHILEQIRSLKSTFNELAPINHLPLELLTLIFEYAIALCTNRSDNKHLYQYVKETFAQDRWGKIRDISHVCRHWHLAALGCPSLWSQIDFSDPAPAVEKMLVRSKSSLLSITIGGRSETRTGGIPDPLASKILDVNRLESLRLSLPPEAIEQELDTIRSSGSSAPHLKSIFIQDEWETQIPRTWPADFEWISTPRLQHLDLSFCNVWQHSGPQYSSLVSLRLFYISNPPTEPFFALLASNPNLETLYLESSLPELPSNPFSHPHMKITLSKLSSCTIEGSSLPQCLDFQDRILYPASTAYLDFCPSKTRTEVMDASDIKKLISSFKIEEPIDGRRRSCLLLDAGFKTPIMVFSRLPCHIRRRSRFVCGYTPHLDDDSSVRLAMDRSRPLGDRTKQPRWLDLLSISGLEKLNIYRLWTSCDVKECLDFFNRHPEITHVTIGDMGSAEHVLTALLDRDLAKEQSEGSDTRIPSGVESRSCLPMLTVLTLQRCIDYGCDERKFVESPVFSPLCQFLSQRRKCGLRIERLELIDFQEIDRAVVKILEDEVGEVVWDDEARVGVKKVADD